MGDVILDASAALACIQNEPGGDLVRMRTRGGVISAINLAEVIAKLIEKGSTPKRAVELIDAMSLEVESVDSSLAQRMGTLHEITQGKGISLGDRACLALAERLNLPILTADRAWAKLDLDLTIELIG